METTTETKRYCLNNKNYATGAELYGLGLMTLIKKEETGGTSAAGTASANVSNTKLKNLKIYVLLMKHLDEEHISIVNSELGPEKEGDGTAVWELFKKKYARSKAHHQMIALGEFIDLEFKETKEFVKMIRSCISKIRTTGLDIKEQILALLILKKLPKEFESLVRIIISDNSVLKIEGDHLQFKIKKPDNVVMTSQVPRKEMKCYNCGIDGHSAKKCRKEWSNYKFAPPKANFGEAADKETKTVAFIGKAQVRKYNEDMDDVTYLDEVINLNPEDDSFEFYFPEEDEDMETLDVTNTKSKHYNPILTELEIFGDLGDLETKPYKVISSARKLEWS